MGSETGSVFVGRAAELEELRRGMADAFAGRGRLFMLLGEAGIGKTRLADEIAAAARSIEDPTEARTDHGHGAS